MDAQKNLLSIVELGGYPDFSALYQRLGYKVEKAHQMRKALSTLKKTRPEAIVTEFNFQSDFRDRTSSLESLLATLQFSKLDSRVVVFYEKEYATQFQKLHVTYPDIIAMPFPIEEATLEAVLQDESQ
ncbi:MAG: hypothetical protein KAT25_09315 [Sulfuriflexus sp.]|nr:hypothetical protein [Sulfuriflexus sp.]